MHEGNVEKRRRTPLEQAFADIPKCTKELLSYTVDDPRWSRRLVMMIEQDVRAFPLTLADLNDFALHTSTQQTQQLERYAQQLADSYFRQSGLGSDFAHHDTILRRTRKCVYLALTQEEHLKSVYAQTQKGATDPESGEHSITSLIKTRLMSAYGTYFFPGDESPIGHTILSPYLIDRHTLSCVQGFFCDSTGERSSDVTTRSFVSALLYVEIGYLLGLFDESHPYSIENILIAREALRFDLPRVSAVTRKALERPFQEVSPRLRQLKHHWNTVFSRRLARENAVQGRQQPTWLDRDAQPHDHRIVGDTVDPNFFLKRNRPQAQVRSIIQNTAQQQLEADYTRAKKHELSELRVLLQQYFPILPTTVTVADQEAFSTYVIATLQRVNISHSITPLLEQSPDTLSPEEITLVDERLKEVIMSGEGGGLVTEYLYSQQENPAPVERVTLILYAFLAKPHLRKEDAQLCELYLQRLHPALAQHSDNKQLTEARKIPDRTYSNLRSIHPEAVERVQERLSELRGSDGMTVVNHPDAIRRLTDMRAHFGEFLHLLRYGYTESPITESMMQMSGYFMLILVLLTGLFFVETFSDSSQQSFFGPLVTIALTLAAMFFQKEKEYFTLMLPESKRHSAVIRSIGLPTDLEKMVEINVVKAAFTGEIKKKRARRIKLMAAIALIIYLMPFAAPIPAKIKDIFQGNSSAQVDASESHTYRRPVEETLYERYPTEYTQIAELNAAPGEEIPDGGFGFQATTIIDSDWNVVDHQFASTMTLHEYRASDSVTHVLQPGQRDMVVLNPSRSFAPPQGSRVVRAFSDSQLPVTLDTYGRLWFEEPPTSLSVVLEADDIAESGVGFIAYESQYSMTPSRPWENWQAHYDEAMALNAQLYTLPDQGLAALHADLVEEYRQLNIELESVSEEEKIRRFDLFIRDTVSRVWLYIREQRTYNDKYPPTSSDAPFSDLLHFSLLMENGTDCDITALAVQDLFTSLNIRTEVQIGYPLMVFEERAYAGIGHAIIAVHTPSGEILITDTTPSRFAPDFDPRSQQLPSPPTREEERRMKEAEEAATSAIRISAAVVLSLTAAKVGHNVYKRRKKRRRDARAPAPIVDTTITYPALSPDLNTHIPPEWQEVINSTPTDAILDVVSIAEIILGYERFQHQEMQSVIALKNIIKRHLATIEDGSVWRDGASSRTQACSKLVLLLSEASDHSKKVVGHPPRTKSFSEMIDFSRSEIERRVRNNHLSHIHRLLSLFLP